MAGAAQIAPASSAYAIRSRSREEKKKREEEFPPQKWASKTPF
jgi:hypothetical protein